MDKDFPRYLFPSVKDKPLAADDRLSGAWSSKPLAEQDENFDQYGICERIIKLNYSYPVRIDFGSDQKNEGLSRIRCLTHKYQASDLVRSITPVMPWRLYSNDLRPSTNRPTVPS